MALACEIGKLEKASCQAHKSCLPRYSIRSIWICRYLSYDLSDTFLRSFHRVDWSTFSNLSDTHHNDSLIPSLSNRHVPIQNFKVCQIQQHQCQTYHRLDICVHSYICEYASSHPTHSRPKAQVHQSSDSRLLIPYLRVFHRKLFHSMDLNLRDNWLIDIKVEPLVKDRDPKGIQCHFEQYELWMLRSKEFHRTWEIC